MKKFVKLFVIIAIANLLNNCTTYCPDIVEVINDIENEEELFFLKCEMNKGNWDKFKELFGSDNVCY